MRERPILLWDVMSTLVTEPFFQAIPAFFEMSLEELLRVKSPDPWIDFEHGRIDEREYAARFFKDGRDFDVEGLKSAMQRCYEWMDGVEPLLQQLTQAGYSMHTLSNYSTWYALIEEKLRVSRYVAWTFVSCDIGLRKPDPQIYLHASSSLELPPERFIFVDDQPRNVEAARQIGMQAILRTDELAQLRADLVALGVTEAR